VRRVARQRRLHHVAQPNKLLLAALPRERRERKRKGGGGTEEEENKIKRVRQSSSSPLYHSPPFPLPPIPCSLPQVPQNPCFFCFPTMNSKMLFKKEIISTFSRTSVYRRISSHFLSADLVYVSVARPRSASTSFPALALNRPSLVHFPLSSRGKDDLLIPEEERMIFLIPVRRRIMHPPPHWDP
jgi:hypothetical protein